MSWGRLDDSLYDHPKVEKIPAGSRLACVGLWTMAISYCNRHLTDGHVTTERIRKLGGTDRLVAALVEAELFERTATGIVVHDFCEYNETRARVIERRDQMRDLGKRGGVRSGETRRTKRDASTEHEAQRQAGRLNTRPDPSHTHTREEDEGYTEALGAVARANGRVEPSGTVLS